MPLKLGPGHITRTHWSDESGARDGKKQGPQRLYSSALVTAGASRRFLRSSGSCGSPGSTHVLHHCCESQCLPGCGREP